MRFLKLRLIWNVIRGRPIIANNTFEGTIKVLSEKVIISNNKMV